MREHRKLSAGGGLNSRSGDCCIRGGKTPLIDCKQNQRWVVVKTITWRAIVGGSAGLAEALNRIRCENSCAVEPRAKIASSSLKLLILPRRGLFIVPSPFAGATMFWKEDFESLPLGIISRPANLNSIWSVKQIRMEPSALESSRMMC